MRFNPNGSVWAIEGITSPDGRIIGKMGHSSASAMTFTKMWTATKTSACSRAAWRILHCKSGCFSQPRPGQIK